MKMRNLYKAHHLTASGFEIDADATALVIHCWATENLLTLFIHQGHKEEPDAIPTY